MVDIVDEEVELRLIDTRQLVKEAKKLKEAKRIADEAKKINKQLSFSGTPIPFIGDDTQALPKSQAKKQTRTGAITGQRTANAFRDLQKKIKNLEKKQKKIKKITDEVRSKILDKVSLAGDVLQSGGNPLSLVTTSLGRFGPVGLIVASAITSVFGLFSREFERGGLFSTKLKITEREKNIVDVDYVIDIRSGTKFITGDLRIAQVIPESSNTQNLKYEHIRYVSQELGV